MDFWSRRRLSTNLLGILLAVAAWALLAWLMLTAAGALGIDSLWSSPIRYCALLCATLLVARLFDRMPAAWAGIGPHRWAGRELLVGLGLGAAMALIAWLPSAFIGGVHPGEGEPATAWGIWVALIAMNAAGEELLFRGYFFQRIMEMTGPTAATLLVSMAFGLAHLANPNVTPASIAIILLGGILFSLAYIRTGSLWLPIGAHIAWNMALGKVLGLPVSGQVLGASILRTGVTGPDVITGGAFGPEGGLAAAVALGLGIWFLARSPLADLSPYVHAEVFRAFRRRQCEAMQNSKC
jgi:membrane protease YdiL (CAAX protease family)